MNGSFIHLLYAKQLPLNMDLLSICWYLCLSGSPVVDRVEVHQVATIRKNKPRTEIDIIYYLKFVGYIYK